MTATGTVLRKRNHRGEGQRLRTELVAAAVAMLAESDGTKKLTLRGLARRVGVSAPSIYQHFADVEELKDAVAVETFAAFSVARDAASEGVTNPCAALLVRCQAYCQFAVDYPSPYRFLFRVRPAPVGPPGPLPGGPALAALTESVARCQAAGVATDGDPVRLATQLWACLHGLVLLRLNLTHFSWQAPLAVMVEDTVTRLLDLHPHRPDEVRAMSTA